MKLKHFDPDEFTMDGQFVYDKMNADFLLKLDTCRELAGVPFTITSSYRSPEKNRRVGGSPGSMHLKGRAVDLKCSDGAQRWKIIQAAMHLKLTVGIMRDGLHLDDRETPIVFHYYPRYGSAPSKEE